MFGRFVPSLTRRIGCGLMPPEVWAKPTSLPSGGCRCQEATQGRASERILPAPLGGLPRGVWRADGRLSQAVPWEAGRQQCHPAIRPARESPFAGMIRREVASMRTNSNLSRIVLGWLLLGILNLTACDDIAGKQGVEIVSHNGYVSADSTGTYRIVVGEVQNTGTTNLRSVKIEATFYDQAGKVHTTSESYALLKILLPGEKSPFRFHEHTAPGVVKYSLKVADMAETDRQPCREFQIVDHEGEIDDLMGWYHIFGEYQYTGTSVAAFPEIIATCRDGDGGVIGVGSQTGTQLEAGEVTSFDLVVFPDDSAPEIVNYELQVECEPPGQ